MPWTKQPPQLTARYNDMTVSFADDGGGDLDSSVYWSSDQTGTTDVFRDGGVVKLSAVLTPAQVTQFKQAFKLVADAVLVQRGYTNT